MATLMVQAIDVNNDPIEGAGGPVFLEDIDACAQIIKTTLGLLLGEWWENLSLGFPLFEEVINTSASSANQNPTALVIKGAIEACPGVIQVTDYSLSINRSLRSSSYSCEVDTVFGTLTVSNAPGISAVVS